MCRWFGGHCAGNLHHRELIVESHEISLSVAFHLVEMMETLRVLGSKTLMNLGCLVFGMVVN